MSSGLFAFHGLRSLCSASQFISGSENTAKTGGVPE